MTSSRLEQLKKNKQDAEVEYELWWNESCEGKPEWLDLECEAERIADLCRPFKGLTGKVNPVNARIMLEWALELYLDETPEKSPAEHSYVRALAELELEKLL